MLDDPDFRPGTDILWNFSSAVVVPPSEEDIFDFTDMVQKSRAKRGSEYKVAMVADKELYYGLLRMYQAYSGPLPIELMVFRSLPEAMHWLKETPRTEQLEDGGT